LLLLFHTKPHFWAILEKLKIKYRMPERLFLRPRTLWETREQTSSNFGPEAKHWKKCYVFWIKCMSRPCSFIQSITKVCSEHLKSVPDLLETLMSEKRLLQAAVLLVRSLKIINKPEMLEIGAVADLRSYLNGQEMVRRSLQLNKDILT
jgi:hypothetical protein